MSTITRNVISSARFSWDADTATFSIEASDLGDQMSAPIFGIESARTGRVVEVTIISEHRDAEGDITHWGAKPVLPDERSLFHVTIFND